MWEKIFEILVNRSPLDVIIIGVSLLLIGAVGAVPFVNPPLLVSGIAWQIYLAAIIQHMNYTKGSAGAII